MVCLFDEPVNGLSHSSLRGSWRGSFLHLDSGHGGRGGSFCASATPGSPITQAATAAATSPSLTRMTFFIVLFLSSYEYLGLLTVKNPCGYQAAFQWTSIPVPPKETVAPGRKPTG